MSQGAESVTRRKLNAVIWILGTIGSVAIVMLWGFDAWLVIDIMSHGQASDIWGWLGVAFFALVAAGVTILVLAGLRDFRKQRVSLTPGP